MNQQNITKNRKGQYMAVEYVMIFALGISVAIGTVTAFTALQDEVSDTSREAEIEVIQSELKTNIEHLKTYGEDSTVSKNIQLPETIAGSSYDLQLEARQINIFINNREYNFQLNSADADQYSYSGDVSGGQITLYKTNNEILIVEG